MKWLIRFVTRRPRGQAVNRDEHVEGNAIGIGRGTDNAVHVPDLRLGFHHAIMRASSDGILIEVEGDADLHLGPRRVESALLKVGDIAHLGPVSITALAPSAEEDYAVAVEVVVPQPDDADRLNSLSKVGLTKSLPSKRLISWALALTILVIFLILPTLSGFLHAPPQISRPDGMDLNSVSAMRDRISFDSVWDTGTMSAPHRFLSNDCRVCHEAPFVMVRDSSCATCHKAVQHHADPQIPVGADLADERCAHCHKEHNGVESPIVQDSALCSGCHDDLRSTIPNTALLDVHAFTPEGHPGFRPAIIVDGVTGRKERVPLTAVPAPLEQSNLKFPHDRHLRLSGKRTPEGVRPITCATCHESDGGLGFRPIEMETDCGGCHTLKFDRVTPNRTVPHSTVTEAAAIVRDHFRSVVLDGNYNSVTAPAVVRRLPGTPMKPEERAEGLAWADLKTKETLDKLSGKQGCGACHVTSVSADSPGGFLVAPVRITQRWLPKGIFDHSHHKETGCISCHDAAKNGAAETVMLPDINSCLACHGAQDASDKVPSTCITCHEFHREGLPPLRPDPLKEAKAP